MGAQGKPLTPQEKETIVTLKKYFDRTRDDPEEHESPSVQKVARALDVSVVTVKRVMADHYRGMNFEEQSETRRRRRPLVLSDSLQTIAREYIREANREGAHITHET